MKQIVSEPTRVGPSSSTIIDLVFTNLEGVEARVTEELKITDHETICIHVGETKINLPEQKKCYVSWKRYTKERLQAALRAKLRRADAGVTVGEAAQTFGSTLATAVAELTDLCSNDRKVSNAWYGEQLRNLKTERDDAYITFKRTKRLDDWNLYKVLRNRYVRGLRSSKNLAVEEEIRSCHGNPKKLWRSLKSLIRPGGEQVEPAVAPAEVRVNEDGSEDLLTELQPITLTKLKETVYSLKDCAAVDSVTKRVMTDSFDVVGEQLLAIVNRSLESGEFPQPWKRTLVIPIPKVPKSTRPEDHRPINILPLYGKVLETIVKEQLLAFVDRTKDLLEEQSGVRKHHSCESALNLLLLKWKQAIEEGKIVLSVFVDLKRTFETIDRTKLKAILRRYGVLGSALKWFSSYMDSRTKGG
ncbi:uncharacterized protein LOC128093838 [Culex pipiens pallens]|uniref:uncharacterized protein LOC128093838 n=1 Tax=Culex pipiens pallens TaxID=42434 RepID=UPI0022AA5EFD|nr:uncharacterized protein LOC128093838 [Culex pipiens pallens]